MPMHTQIHSCVRVCVWLLLLFVYVSFLPSGTHGDFLRYWLLTFYAVCCFKIAHFMHMTERTLPIFSTTRVCPCTHSHRHPQPQPHIHTHTHTQTCQQRVEELRELLSTTRTALWLLLLCIAVDFSGVFYEMDSPLITKLRPSRWLLGYAAGSTKALSAACHATGIYKCQTGQRRAARGGSITCRRRCMKLHTELSYDTCLIAKAFGRVDCV